MRRTSTSTPRGASKAAVAVGVVYRPPGLFDVEAERARLTKERAALDADLVRVRGKLGNDGFVAKAPPEVVAGEREKASRMAQRRPADRAARRHARGQRR